MSDIHNAAGGVPTTGHVWDDDLGDFTNQPPKWWMLGLTASAIWVCVYWLMYPSIPVAIAGKHWTGIGLPGTGQWSAIQELENEVAMVEGFRQKYEDKIKGMTPAQIMADADLSEYVKRSGKVLFGDNCAACHGTNGVGVVGRGTDGLMAPILNDDDWLFGGQVGTIHETIMNGRQGMMTPHKDTLSAQQIDDVAKYVKALSEGNGDSADVAAGKAVFETSDCTGCHGADAKGMQAMGSANLTDKVWRFDGSIDGIKQTITYGVNAGEGARVAVMPAFKAAGKLSDSDMKKLAVYVHSFGGGQPEAAPAAAEAAPAADAASAPAAQ